MKDRNYDLLLEIKDSVDELRNELVPQIDDNRKNIVALQISEANLMGKIGMGVIFVGGAVTFIMNVIYQFVINRIK